LPGPQPFGLAEFLLVRKSGRGICPDRHSRQRVVPLGPPWPAPPTAWRG